MYQDWKTTRESARELVWTRCFQKFFGKTSTETLDEFMASEKIEFYKELKKPPTEESEIEIAYLFRKQCMVNRNPPGWIVLFAKTTKENKVEFVTHCKLDYDWPDHYLLSHGFDLR